MQIRTSDCLARHKRGAHFLLFLVLATHSSAERFKDIASCL